MFKLQSWLLFSTLIFNCQSQPLDHPLKATRELCTGGPANDDSTLYMKNIGYLLSGYDIYHGNPLSFKGVPGDPGLRQQIFDVQYNGGMSADGRYCVPDGLLIRQDISCNLNFITEFLTGTKKYTEELNSIASIDVNLGLLGAFGASTSYGYIKEMTEKSMHYFTKSEIACSVYSGTIQEYISPPFHPNFIGGLSTLTEEYNEKIYSRFLHAFGTHFIQDSHMGSYYLFQSMISSQSWMKMISENLDIGAYVKAAAMASANFTFGYNKTMSEDFHQYSSEQITLYKGKKPPTGQNMDEWITGSIEEPQPIKTNLVPLYDLYLYDYINDSVLANLKKAIDEYCPKLLENGELETCDELPEDPPLPKPRHYTKWSTDNHAYSAGMGIEWPVLECPEGDWIEAIQWFEDQHHHGITDVRIKCAKVDEWSDPSVGDYDHGGLWHGDGDWNHAVTCKDGFGQLVAKDEYVGLRGVVNVKHWCFNSQVEIETTETSWGKYKRELPCGENQQVVGVQIREEVYHGVIDLRIKCA